MSFDNLNESLDLSKDLNGRYFKGTVTQNVDELGLDRIQASVPGLYDPSQGQIPWIMPFKTSPFGIGDGWGVYGSPAIGSEVKVWLQDGDPHFPVYSSLQTKTNSDFPSGTCWGFVDPYGNKLKVSDDKNILFSSASGVTLSIDPTGLLTVTTASDCDLNVSGNLNATIAGDANIVATTTTMVGDFNLVGTFYNNGTNMTTHVHGGVSPGGSTTSTPE